MNAKSKIGLFGGSFDPIHTGHLIFAQAAVEFVGLERVLFIPTAAPPHKKRGDLTGIAIRREMVELAIEDNPHFELSLIEVKREVSYTYESVLHFREEGYGRDQIHILIGGDSLEEILTWKNYRTIYRNSTIVTLQRPGHRLIPPLPDEAAVIILETGSSSISSSEVRKLIRDGKAIRYLVPRPVERLIIERSLYRQTG